MEIKCVRTDEQIVNEVLSGEPTAYTQLVQRYERQIHAIAWQILRNHHAAEDVTQEVFIKAYQRLGDWRRHTLGAWLITIARRTAIDQLRRSKQITVEVQEIAATDPSAIEDAAEVLAAIGRLNKQDQQIILLRYFSNLQVSEIAAITGSPIGTITKQLSRAIAKLREYVNK